MIRTTALFYWNEIFFEVRLEQKLFILSQWLPRYYQSMLTVSNQFTKNVGLFLPEALQASFAA